MSCTEKRNVKVGDRVQRTSFLNSGIVPEKSLGTVTTIDKESFRVKWDNKLEFKYDNKREFKYYDDSSEIEFLDSEQININEKGGKQSEVSYAFHLLPYDAILSMAACVKEGHDKYDTPGDQQNWKKIPLEEHVNHSVGHSYLGLSGDMSDNHFVNAAVRAMFALQMHLEGKK